MSWTDERIETLKTLWGSGKTAAEIAEELGGVSRNAVIGKANRLGLSGKSETPAKKAAPKPKAKAKEKAKEKPKKLPSHRACQWPFGHPGDADFHFCGEEAVPGKPYCAQHCALAYQTKDSAAA